MPTPRMHPRDGPHAKPASVRLAEKRQRTTELRAKRERLKREVAVVLAWHPDMPLSAADLMDCSAETVLEDFREYFEDGEPVPVPPIKAIPTEAAR